MKINKLLKPLTLSILLPLGITANAAMDSSVAQKDFFYVDAKGGAIAPSTTQGNSDLQSVTPNSTYTLGLAFGKKFMDRFGAELEYMYRGKSDIDNSAGTISNTWSVSANTFMFNLTADMVTGSMIRPYAKVGVGYSINDAGQYKYTTLTNTQTWKSDNSSHFAWQAGFGLAMNTSEMIETKIEYAFVDRGEFKTGSGAATVTSDGESNFDSASSARTGKLRDHTITLAVGYKF